VDLPQRDEFGELGDFFNTVSARLSADRPSPATALLAANLAKNLGSDKDPLEDAVAIFNPDGKLLFANPAMRATLPQFLTEPLSRSVRDLYAPEHPYRKAVEEATATKQSHGPVSAYLPTLTTDRVDENGLPAPRERLILTHVIDGLDHRPAAVMLVARNLDYMTQVRSSFSYSQKLAALSRLSAGVAHEVKNPLNATVIHLELLKQQLSSSDLPLAMEHLSIITAQIRRLDEVVQGFLRFIRPEDLKLQPISVASLVDAIMPVVVAEARKYGVDVNVAVPDNLPVVSVDASVLQQALMNLALNACQAMPQGGRLRISAAAIRGRRVEILCEDNGVGIAPEHLNRIFDLYFTTKEGGSGIGLSLVYRAIQLVDGEIEVQSTPGRGTTFRVLLPQA
jgi:signal transduction histidine kinase